MEKAFYSIIENDILEDTEISDKALRIYIVVSNYSNNKDGYCYLTHKQLMNKCRVKKAQFYNILDKLISRNYLTRIKKNNRVYLQPTINKTIALRSYGNKYGNKTLIDYDWLNDRN